MEGKRKRKQVIVGHVPLTLSRIFHLFLKYGGQISVQVTEKRSGTKASERTIK